MTADYMADFMEEHHLVVGRVIEMLNCYDMVCGKPPAGQIGVDLKFPAVWHPFGYELFPPV
jgi:hypothetical protein